MQGYRHCLDMGAELVIASAQAIDGSFVGDLRLRSSFLLQAQAALKALAEEVRLPLLLGSYAAAPHCAPAQPAPFLIAEGQVHRLNNRCVVQVGALSIFTDVGGEEPVAPPPDVHCDCILHLPGGAWHIGQAQEWAALSAREAAERHCAVVIAQGIGCTAGHLHAGGSMYTTPGGEACHHLPLFDAAEATLPMPEQPPCEPLQAPELSAILYCLRETMEQGGYHGIAVAADEAHGPLLLALAQEAVGAEYTTGMTWEKTPSAFGRSICLPQLPPACSPALQQRIRSQVIADRAAEHKLLLLRSCGRKDMLLGEAQLPADACGLLAPLGDMYDSMIHRVREALVARHGAELSRLLPPPPGMPPEVEHELRMLADEGQSPFEMLLTHGCEDESRLRRMLRRINRAAAQPPSATWILHVHKRSISLPPFHRLVE